MTRRKDRGPRSCSTVRFAGRLQFTKRNNAPLRGACPSLVFVAAAKRSNDRRTSNGSVAVKIAAALGSIVIVEGRKQARKRHLFEVRRYTDGIGTMYDDL